MEIDPGINQPTLYPTLDNDSPWQQKSCATDWLIIISEQYLRVHQYPNHQDYKMIPLKKQSNRCGFLNLNHWKQLVGCDGETTNFATIYDTGWDGNFTHPTISPAWWDRRCCFYRVFVFANVNDWEYWVSLCQRCSISCLVRKGSRTARGSTDILVFPCSSQVHGIAYVGKDN